MVLSLKNRDAVYQLGKLEILGLHQKKETWECFFSYINKYQDLNIGMNAKPFPNNK